jgi:hypothetical protein
MYIRKHVILFCLAIILTACGSTPNWDSYSPVEAGKLQAQGLSASEANHYREMGFTSDTIQDWFDAGFRRRDNITAWHDASFNAPEAGQWHAIGFGLKDAHTWREQNFSAEEAQNWQEKGFDLKDAKKLRSKGLSAD